MSRLRDPADPVGSRIMGVGAYRPQRVVSTELIATGLGVDPAWLDRRTGIRNRRYAGADETLTAMSSAAGQQALERAGIAAGELDCTIAASMTQLLPMPSLASMTAHQLGARSSGSYDVSAACAGFCYALAAASDMVRSGSARHVLVIGAERLTDILDPHDQATAPLFADGAGAVVLGPADEPGVGPAVWGGDGSKAGAVGMNGPFPPFGSTGSVDPAISMVGWQVYRWATEQLAAAAQRAVERAGLKTDEIDVFVPHQANLRVMETLAGRIGLRPDVVCARDIVEAGNTSAASIPMALATLLDSQPELSGATALLMGFGSGLTYAAQVVLLP